MLRLNGLVKDDETLRHKEHRGSFIRFWLSSSCYVIGLSKTCCILSIEGCFRNFHWIMKFLPRVFQLGGMCDLQSAENIVQTMHKIFAPSCSISNPFCRRVNRGGRRAMTNLHTFHTLIINISYRKGRKEHFNKIFYAAEVKMRGHKTLCYDYCLESCVLL